MKEEKNNHEMLDMCSAADVLLENEVAANRIGVYTHLWSLAIVVVVVICYICFLDIEVYDEIGEGWVVPFLIGPMNVLAYALYHVIGLRSNYLKYVNLGIFTLIAVMMTAVVGTPEFFMMFIPIVLSIRYFQPRLTWIMTILMIVLTPVTILFNVRWGNPDINMLFLPEGTVITWTDRCEPLFLAAGPDYWRTVLNHFFWYCPVWGLFLLFAGWVSAATASAGRRMVLEEAERVRNEAAEKARSHFFAAVSHDIRTPLNAIIGFSELLQSGIENEKERHDAIESIVYSGKTLLQLINDVLDLSKLEAGKMEIALEPTDIKALVEQVLKAFRLAAGKANVDMQMDVSVDDSLVLDPQRIRQILFNLVGNAVKFTERGHIKVIAKYVEKTFTLSVEDTGTGIAKEDQPRLMMPYVQLDSKAKHQGTGLGLSICMQLARRMGGELTLVSTLGIGSTFSLVIPNVELAAKPNATSLEWQKGAVAAPKEGVSTSRRILIVDDSPVNITMLKAMLKSMGYQQLLTAKDGREALTLLHENEDVYLVLTDMWMAEMDGEELVREIRKEARYLSLKVYAVTADVETRKTFKEMGFDGLLLKPLTREKLTELFKSLP